jgi:hypothetical protein
MDAFSSIVSSYANGVLYSKVINDIIPNQPVIVEAM